MDTRKLFRTLTIGEGAILVPHIDRYLEKGRFPDTWDINIRNYKERDEFFHPSSDCLTPVDKLYVQMTAMGEPHLPSASLRKTFDCGHMWHGYIQSILIAMGFVRSENVERQHLHVTPLFTARGTVDLLDVAIPGHPEPWIVDIKTMRSDDFKAGPNKFTMEKYEAQINVYGDWFNRKNLMILGVQKDSPHDFREWIIQPNPELVQEIYDRWATVAQAVREKTPPSI